MRYVISIILFLLAYNSLCLGMEKVDRAMIDRANRQMDEGTARENSWNNNIKSKLYINMPKEEFMNIFGAYVFKEDGDSVYFYEPETEIKSCVIFHDGKLIKYERFGRTYGILGTGRYDDVSNSLNGYEDKDHSGFYFSMKEKDFLNEFSDSVLSLSQGRYIVEGKNGRKYKITFNNGLLTGIEGLR